LTQLRVWDAAHFVSASLLGGSLQLLVPQGTTSTFCRPKATATATPGATNTPTLTTTPGPSPTPTNTATVVPTATASTTPAAPFNNATFVYDGDGKRVKSIFNGTTTTYFVGAHYEVTGSTITKYYYAGSQRIAMRTNGTLNYLLGDHLGSTSLTTNASGQIVSELRYTAWGETRYSSGNTAAKYQYTGQFSYESDFGLHFYNARWYDPHLNHFTQPDSIEPDPYNSRAWDRYAYANNNPLYYTDPDGHIPWPIVILGGAAGLIAGYTSLHLLGILPDYRGVDFAEEHVTDQNTIVAAGLAVQSEWYVEWWDKPSNELSSSYGPAQITQAEIQAYGLTSQNLQDPGLAVQVMTRRINDVVSACSGCIDRDKVILAALAQNGSEYALNALADVSGPQYGRLEDGGLNWEKYFNSLNSKGNLYDLRAIGHHNYDSRFMLHLFMNNLKELEKRGWNLPELTPDDWKYINDLR
jgi:RHS repeat-associated protein